MLWCDEIGKHGRSEHKKRRSGRITLPKHTTASHFGITRSHHEGYKVDFNQVF